MPQPHLARGAFARLGFVAAILLAAVFAAYGPTHTAKDEGAAPRAILSHHPPDLILAVIMLLLGFYVAAIQVKRVWWDNR